MWGPCKGKSGFSEWTENGCLHKSLSFTNNALWHYLTVYKWMNIKLMWIRIKQGTKKRLIDTKSSVTQPSCMRNTNSTDSILKWIPTCGISLEVRIPNPLGVSSGAQIFLPRVFCSSDIGLLNLRDMLYSRQGSVVGWLCTNEVDNWKESHIL